MRIALIKPSLGEQGGRPYRTPAVLEPLVFAVIAGLTPPDVELRLFDERFEDIPFGETFDLVAITVETFTARRAYQIAREFQDRGVKVVMGGFHPTLLPQEASRFADVLALGPAEGTWPHILQDLRGGTLKKTYAACEDPDAAFVQPLRSIFAGKEYLPLTLVETSRGCLHQCQFCAVRKFYRNLVTFRPIPDVVREIRELGKTFIFFVDDNIIANPAKARELFMAIKPLNIRWVSQASLETVSDPIFLDLMKESGCFALILGLESLSTANLQQMKKGWTIPFGSPAKALEEYRKRGILIYATFVFGYDDDHPAIFSRTAEFALAQKLFMANFNILQPFPGTELYEKLEGEGRLLYERWWAAPEYRWDFPAFRPRGLTPEGLAKGVRDVRRRFNSLSGVFTRSLDFRANLADPFRAMVFFAGNFISRRDISRKQGLTLGFRGKTEKQLETRKERF